MIPVLACLLALAACSSPSAEPSSTVSATPSTSATPTATASSTIKVQDSLDAITVTGKQLKQPTVKVKTPFVIDKTRVKVLDKGTGYQAVSGGSVTVHTYGVDGRTGETFYESYSDGTAVTFSLAEVITGFQDGLVGQRAGSRVLIAMPGEDGYDAAGGNSSAGIEVGDTLIFVVDILAVSVDQPEGMAITPPAGLPTVTGGAADKPTVTIPSGSAPGKMSSTVLIEGTGPKLAKSDAITARYVGYSWKTGKLVDDGFDTPTSGALSGTIPGWQTGLVGKRVGSRVLLVLPPDDAFGKDGSATPPVEGGDTVVYVVDILFSQAAAG